jgi:hypothetical protein
MYASLEQLIRGWSRILYDALGRRAGRLAVRLVDVLVFCQSGHLALAASLVMLAAGVAPSFAPRLLLLSLVHHVLMFAVFRLVYNTSVARSRHTGWFPLGNVIIDVILLRAIRMCLTGRVNWRDTQYATAGDAARSAGGLESGSRVA